MKVIAFQAVMAVYAALFVTDVWAAANVKDFVDIAAFEAQGAGDPNINIEQYSVAQGITTGGGQFILGLTGCAPDEGVILKDSNNNCY